ncbi:ketosteroid isomerase-related protein [Arenimonas sp. MALMAid1274]|uniref:ketosteroid isomerase-related protein n=1 Tax=Arenimonas sp. MALMAid1274 TaxID=3411630 RepID=UPI003BA2348D
MIIDGNRAADRAIELVLGYYAAFNRGDWEGMLALVTDDVAHDINQGARETGKAAFAAFLGRMNACYREQLKDIVVMANQAGARASAEYVVHGQYLKDDAGLPPAHGQAYVLPGGAFFDIRGNRIARVTNHYNLGDWIAQVSKSP